MRGTRVGAILAIMTLGAVASAPNAKGEVWYRRFPVRGPLGLRVLTDRAHVRLIAWRRPRVDIQVNTEGWNFGPEGLRAAARQDSNQVRVEVLLPPWGFDPNWVSRFVEVVIQLPESAEVRIQTDEGDITLRGMKGSFWLRTLDGLITAERLSGRIEMDAGDGTVSASDLDGRVAARSWEGNLEVRGRFDRLALTSLTGDVIAHVADGSTVEAPWSLEATDGFVSLEIPERLGATLDAETGRGHIEWAGRGLPEGLRRLQTRLGEGGATILLRAGKGIALIQRR